MANYEENTYANIKEEISEMEKMLQITNEKRIKIERLKNEKILEIKKLEDEQNKINQELKDGIEKKRKRKKELGEDIRELLYLLKDELVEKMENRTIENLKSMSKSVKDIGEELDVKIRLFELLSNEKTSEDDILLKNDENTESNYEHIFDENAYILDPRLQLSRYYLNNKVGYSLKNFAQDYKNEIKKVCEHFDGEIDDIINYFQEKHGLCNGTIISPTTFQQACYESLRITHQKIRIYYNSKRVEGSTNREIFKNLIANIGVSEVYSKCHDLFNKSFEISPDSKAHSEHVFVEKMFDHRKNRSLYLKTHLNTNQIIDLVKKINKKIPRNIFIPN